MQWLCGCWPEGQQGAPTPSSPELRAGGVRKPGAAGIVPRSMPDSNNRQTHTKQLNPPVQTYGTKGKVERCSPIFSTWPPLEEVTAIYLDMQPNSRRQPDKAAPNKIQQIQSHLIKFMGWVQV